MGHVDTLGSAAGTVPGWDFLLRVFIASDGDLPGEATAVSHEANSVCNEADTVDHASSVGCEATAEGHMATTAALDEAAAECHAAGSERREADAEGHVANSECQVASAGHHERLATAPCPDHVPILDRVASVEARIRRADTHTLAMLFRAWRSSAPAGQGRQGVAVRHGRPPDLPAAMARTAALAPTAAGAARPRWADWDPAEDSGPAALTDPDVQDVAALLFVSACRYVDGIALAHTHVLLLISWAVWKALAEFGRANGRRRRPIRAHAAPPAHDAPPARGMAPTAASAGPHRRPRRHQRPPRQ